MAAPVRNQTDAHKGVSPQTEVSFPTLPEDNDELRHFLADSPTDFFVPDPSQRLEWCRNVAYPRILTVCDSAEAKFLLSWMTSNAMLHTEEGAPHAKQALQAMDTPDRIPVFINVIKENRLSYLNRIYVFDMLQWHKNPEESNPFYQGLPPNVLKVLEMEDRLNQFIRESELQGTEREQARAKLIEEIDGEMDAFAKSLQPQAESAQLDPRLVASDNQSRARHLRQPDNFTQLQQFFATAPSDDQLRKFLKDKPADFVIPSSGQRLEWCRNIKYPQILEVCDAEKARFLLSWMMGSLLSTEEGAVHARHALRAMDTPDRIPVFIEVVQESRGRIWNTIVTSDLLQRHNKREEGNPFHNGLPPNVLTVLKIEDRLNAFDFQPLQPKRPEFIQELSSLFQKFDLQSETVELIKTIQDRLQEISQQERSNARAELIQKIDGELAEFADTLKVQELDQQRPASQSEGSFEKKE